MARLHNRGSAPTTEAPAVRLQVSRPGANSGRRRRARPRPSRRARPSSSGSATCRCPPGSVASKRSRIRTVAWASRTKATTPVTWRGIRGSPAALRSRRRPPASSCAFVVSAPVAGATIEVTSPLRAGVVLASATAGADGRATLTVPHDPRTPVLRVTASAPGCPPAVRLATPTAGATAPLDLDDRAARARRSRRPAADPAARRHASRSRAALPGLLQIDDEAPAAVTFGTKLTLARPGARVRVRQSSANGTSFYDQTIDVPRDAERRLVIDAAGSARPGRRPRRRRGPAVRSAVDGGRRHHLGSAGGVRDLRRASSAAARATGVYPTSTSWRSCSRRPAAFPFPAGPTAACGARPSTPACASRSTSRAGTSTDAAPTRAGSARSASRGAAHAADPLLVPAALPRPAAGQPPLHASRALRKAVCQRTCCDVYGVPIRTEPRPPSG